MDHMQQHADTVLDLYKGLRTSRACYPCAKRKIRCEGNQPCTTCSQRGHPDICFFPESRHGRRIAAASRKRRASLRTKSPAAERRVLPAASDAASIEEPSNAPPPLAPASLPSQDQQRPLLEQHPHNVAQEARSSCDTQMGRLSLAALVHEKLSPQNLGVSQDVRSSLGLENLIQNESFLRTFGARDSAEGLLQSCPRRDEARQLFPLFRTHVAPFYPIVDDVDALEMRLLTKMDDYERITVRDSAQLHAFLAQSSPDLALFLSVFALGAQFSHLPSIERTRQGQELVQRSESFLRLSNYMAKPCIETVQTLLCVGLHMQNFGQSDAAWCLHGLTFRFAQALGLQSDSTGQEHPLWNAILWQDCLLSLRFDRLPMSPGRAPPLSHPVTSKRQEATSYINSMLCVNSVCLVFLSSTEQERARASAATARIASIDKMLTKSAPHLRRETSCTSVQQRLECLALRMHSSFLCAELCRPFLAQATVDSESTTLYDRCLESMQTTVQAYLDMSKMSILPSRSWSLTHEALTCACVLALLQPAPNNAQVHNILNNMQQVLEEDFHYDDGEAHFGNDRTFRRGAKLLSFLRKPSSDIPEAGTSFQQRGPPGVEGGATMLGCEQDRPGPAIGLNGPSSNFASPPTPLASDFNQTLLASPFGETGLDFPLSSFLDFSTDFMA